MSGMSDVSSDVRPRDGKTTLPVLPMSIPAAPPKFRLRSPEIDTDRTIRKYAQEPPLSISENPQRRSVEYAAAKLAMEKWANSMGRKILNNGLSI